jgi:hypothetical protein
MTVQTTSRLVIYRGNGIATEFPFNFEIPEDTLIVSIQDWETKEILEIISPGDYSVIGLDDPAGGVVTYTPASAPLDETKGIVILREVPYTQELAIRPTGGFNPEVVEQQLDQIVMQIQQLAEIQSRSLLVSPGATPPTLDEINQAVDAAADALAAAEAAQLAAESVSIKRVVDIAELKPLNTSLTKLAFLPDDTGFDFKAIDSVAAAALDPSENIVVKADNIPLATGAWYRRLKGDQPGVRDAFKAKGDGLANDTQAIQDAVYWMEFYPLRSRALTFERGIFDVTGIEIPNDITGISFNGASFWDTNIRCAVVDGEPVIDNKSQEFKMFDMTVNTVTPPGGNTEMWNAGKIGIRNDKGIGETADVDMTLNRCRIAGFAAGILHRGRGLSAHVNHFSSCRYGVQFDFHNAADYTGQDEGYAFSDDAAFRGLMISNTRFHSFDIAAIANIGVNGHKMRGLSVDNIQMDIGRRLFVGHLGEKATIINAKAFNTRTEVLQLTGGSNFILSGIIGFGGTSADDTTTPTNLVRLEAGADAGGTTGIYRGGIFSDFQLGLSEEDAVVMTAGTQFLGTKFNDFIFDGIGYKTPGDFSPFLVQANNSDIEINRPVLIATANRRSFVHNSGTGNKINVDRRRRSGANTTPATSGANAADVIVDRHTTYAPTITPVTAGLTASAATTFDWVEIAEGYIQVSGRITAQVTTAGACVLRVSLPKPSDFANNGHASGTFIATSTGLNVAGGVVADPTTDTLEVRWLAPSTASIGFSFTAVYRVL